MGIAFGIYSYTYTIIPNRAISEFGWVVTAFSSIIAAICIAALSVPQAQLYVVSKQARIYANENQNGIENAIGKWNYNKFFIIFFASEILLLFTYLGINDAIRTAQKEKEYMAYGRVIPTIISSTHWKKGTWAKFSFQHKNITYQNSLKANVNVGDTVYIIYSTNNPNIVDWAYEWVK